MTKVIVEQDDLEKVLLAYYKKIKGIVNFKLKILNIKIKEKENKVSIEFDVENE